jgi:CBS domain-containing protein
MRIGEILDRKGDEVVTIRADATLHDVLRQLEHHSIGSLVVSTDGRDVEGIITERDLVRVLARQGAAALDGDVRSTMTRSVQTCGREATCDEVMAMMTNSRFRHLPVVEDGVLVGIISIGDVVKSTIDELEVRAESLESYVTGAY